MTPEKISCGICRDLLPLVLDGVAAPESEAARACPSGRLPRMPRGVAGRMRGYALPRPGYPPG